MKSWNALSLVDPPERSWKPPLLDVGLALCIGAISVLIALDASDDAVPGAESPETWWHWVILLTPPAAVAFRRSQPLVATPVAVGGQMMIWGMGLVDAFFAPLVMIYSVAASGEKNGVRLGVLSSIVLSLMAGVGVVVAPDVTVGILLLTMLSSGVALILGLSATRQREVATELADELATTRSEQRATRTRAALAERQRIARELHDLVGHSLSVIALRAEAAQRVGDTQPRALGDAVAAIGSTARSSLAEVRRVLHAVRGTDEAAELAPVANLSDLPALIDEAAASGLAVDLRLSIDGHAPIDAVVGAGAYRIVQEALTNVVKHAGDGANCTVEATIVDDLLKIAVVDDGRGWVDGDGDPVGAGIAGMRERATLLGGQLTTGPAPGGGFAVRAELPLDGEGAGA